MKEKTQITIIVSIILLIGFWQAYLSIFEYDFSFSKTTLTIDGNKVSERLTFIPDKNLHTLYRNLITNIIDNDSMPVSGSGAIIINKSYCSHGMSYWSTYSGKFYTDKINYNPYNYPYNKYPYTANNEYGCTFGNTFGFQKDLSYEVGADFTLYPSRIIKKDGKNYIKFVAYSPKKHPLLIKGQNLIIEGDGIISKNFFTPDQNVIIYIPYETDAINLPIIEEKGYDFSHYNWLITLILSLLPGICTYILWRVHGKENVEGDYPEELSQYPNERKPWEVAAYFEPPFNNLGKNFLPTMVMDFYNRKIIDIKDENKKPLIKILKRDTTLDNVEKEFMKLLESAEKITNKKGDYFSMKEASSKIFKNYELASKIQSINSEVNKKSKKYIDKTGIYLLTGALVIIYILIRVDFRLIILFLDIIILAIVITKSSLFIKFEKEYYLEYQQWQGFKNYLKTLDSMKRSPPQAVVLWEKYLVYATALGVGKNVAKKLKDWKIIDNARYNNYAAVYHPLAFGTVGNTGRGVSGGGGMGGGGIGGGGGGGR